MSPLRLALHSLWSRPLPAVLSILATACSVALLCAVLLLSTAVGNAVARNARDIDVVVGAKGSPLQVILSTIYHADAPTGNMSGGAARIVASHPQVRGSIPLALGDSVNGFRIVGTSPDYLTLYDAQFADGRIWSAPMEAVAGVYTGMKTGDKFAGSHGLAAGGEEHAHRLYTVTGVLAPTGTVLDRLVLTSVQSVYEIHNVIAHAPEAPPKEEHAHEHEHEHGDDHAAEHTHEDAASAEEEPHDHGPQTVNHPVTALLLFTTGPMDRINLPREINNTGNLIAASPSYEIARLMQRVGLGRDATMMLGAGLGILAALIILTTLATGLSARRYDLAVLRVMGGSPAMLLSTIMAEGLLLAVAGGVIGIAAGHGLAIYAVTTVQNLGGLIPADAFVRLGAIDAKIIGVAAVAGLGAALIPAVMAARANIADILARGR